MPDSLSPIDQKGLGNERLVEGKKSEIRFLLRELALAGDRWHSNFMSPKSESPMAEKGSSIKARSRYLSEELKTLVDD